MPRPELYWIDLTLSAGVGWSAFVVAGAGAMDGVLPVGAALLAVLALYRAVLFIHELAHLRRGAVPGFELAWNLVVGIPLMVPSLMYVGSHADHHRRDLYGTAGDPEYETLGEWSAARIVASSLLVLAVPGLLALRWGVLGPLSLLVPAWRRALRARASTLVINPAYRRPLPRGRARRRWWLGELGAALFFWGACMALASGALGMHWLALWYVVGAGVLSLNQIRTLAAHRYVGRGHAMDTTAQLLDSVNLTGSAWLLAPLAPVGLRYHALHHMAPALPYHVLGAVHRRLVEVLPPEAAYHACSRRSLGSLLRELLRSAAPVASVSEGRPPAAGEGARATRTGTGVAAGGR